MKKLLSLLLAIVMTLGLTVSVSAATKVTKKAPVITEVSKTGVIKGFNEKSVLVNENGRSVGYTFDQNIKIVQLGNECDVMETAKKGLVVDYKVKYIDGKPTNLITFMDIAAPGLEGEGFLTMAVNNLSSDLVKLTSGSNVPFNIALNNVRANITDSSLAASTDLTIVDAIKPDAAGNISMTIVDVKEVEPNEDSAYQYADTKKVNLGDINIVKDSVVVKVNDKQLKVIEGAATFDPANNADEVKLVLTKTFYSLEFEAAYAEKKPATQEEFDKILNISYKVKNYKVITSEVTTYEVNDDIYSELNGKEATLTKALNRGNYAFVLTNGLGQLIYLNTFYRDLSCEVVSKSGDKLTIKVSKPGKIPYTETLTLSPDVLAINALEEEVQLSAINAGDKIVLTTDPEQQYQVVKIVK